MSDDVEDDDEPPLSLNAPVTKPNSKKRRSSPQGYGSRPKKPKGPESNFLFGDRDSITVQPNSKARTDPKQFSPGQNVDHIEISSDAPSSDEAVEHLQLEDANSAEPAAQQKKQQLTANDSFTVNNSLEAPTRKPKEANTSSYTLPVSPPHQLNAPSHPGNDGFIGNAANYDSIVKAPSRLRAIHRQLAPKQDIIQDVVREYDRGGSKITATLLKRQRGEFEPTVNTFHGSFQTMSKTFARAAQGIEAEEKAATGKTEAFENSYKKRKQHMCKLREAIRENLVKPGTV
ncbi:uncharacterized protein PG986_013171 [Apiospora aurea]|uniref:Uncharacterized protein n=1 Tax=Apiospora aurea TaxID=335848 RepID=A0ABR1PUT9_9PEZI